MVLIYQIGLCILLSLILLSLLVNLAAFPFFFYAMFMGAFYAPTPMKKVKRMVGLLKLKKNARVLDLGSGDGRIVIEFAKMGYHADGIEINPFLVWRSRVFNWWSFRNDRSAQRRTRFFCRNFWQADFSDYDLVVVYGITRIMPRLEKKLRAELKPSAKIISHGFKFPHLKVGKEDGDLRVYSVD